MPDDGINKPSFDSGLISPRDDDPLKSNPPLPSGSGQQPAEIIMQREASKTALKAYERPNHAGRSATIHHQHTAFRQTPSFPLHAPVQVDHEDSEGLIGSQAPTDNLHPSRSFFEGAHNFRMNTFQYIDHLTINSPPNVEYAEDHHLLGWDKLVKRIAPNALHNSDARYDAPKCDEDTRVEVTGELMEWIEDRDGPQRLLCMTGAAGSGKSSLQQTIAERCSDLGILGSTFFFSNGDPTRNTVSTIIPTIVFQIGSHSPVLKRHISMSIERDTIIFERSLRTQANSLLVRPLKELQEHAGLDLATIPHAILIDGLDECKGEDRQAELLTVIEECLLIEGLSFRVFITSRPEWAIRTALEPGGHLHAAAYRIELNDKYDASADMRRYLWRRFQDLSFRTRNPSWFTKDDIEILVRAGSGQFIYVATVFRYVSERRASPAERLKIVLTWTPHEGQKARPFEALDKLYTDILLTAKSAYEAIDTHSGQDFLLLFNIYHFNRVHGFDNTIFVESALNNVLGMDDGFEEILVSDLHSLVTLKKRSNGPSLSILHKSFSDFLDHKARAKDMFVPPARLYAHLIKCCLQRLQSRESPLLWGAMWFLPGFWTHAPHVIDDEIIKFTREGGWQKLDSMPHSPKYDFLVYFPLGGFKERHPEVFAVISPYLVKWERERQDLEKLWEEEEEEQQQ